MKNSKNELNIKNSKGITLIALVITIIVLIILAGVSINLVLGDNGIVKKAKEAKTKTEEAKLNEEQMLNEAVNFIENEGKIVIEGPVTPDVPDTPSGEPLASKIKPENYGDKINYSANGITDWKIFYNDGTNVYIVASDYLSHGGRSDTSKIVSGTGMTKSGTYRAYWNKAPSSADTTNHVAKFSPVTAETKAWSGNYSTISNGKCVSTLLDTTLWSSYASGVGGESAIGSPTLNMFVASWNEKYPSDKIYCNNDSATGYYLGLLSAPTTYYADLAGKSGYGNTLYYPYQSTVDSGNCYGYWLASPSAYNPGYMMIVDYRGDVDSDSYDFYNYGVRPTVSLSSDVKGTSTTTDGVTTWTLIN